MAKKCLIDGCCGAGHWKGLCSKHYQATIVTPTETNKWKGSLNMGLRLSASQKRKANYDGDYIQPVRMNYAKV